MSGTAWDVAVIGGGPAGCSAAISLARSGYKVVLFEAKTYPHEKLCGEFLSPECAGLLGSLGLSERIEALKPRTIQSVTITAPDGTAWEERLPGPALGLSRKTLDAALAEHAQQMGVTVQERSTVTGLSGGLAEGFELDVTGRKDSSPVCARAVIAAHGKRSAFDRALSRKFLKKHQPFVAIKAHFHGPPIPGRIELHTFPGGYCGMSEIEGGAQVLCLLADERIFRQVRGQREEGLERFVDWMKNQNLYISSWLQWASRIPEHWTAIAQVPFVRKPVMERDVLMAGDAAGLIAPFAGNGIAMALEGGQLAAGYLGHYLNGEIPLKDLKRGYPAAWEKRFGARLRLGRMLQPMMLNPRAVSFALRVFNNLPPFGRFLIAHTRSAVPQISGGADEMKSPGR